MKTTVSGVYCWNNNSLWQQIPSQCYQPQNKFNMYYRLSHGLLCLSVLPTSMILRHMYTNVYTWIWKVFIADADEVRVWTLTEAPSLPSKLEISHFSGHKNYLNFTVSCFSVILVLLYKMYGTLHQFPESFPFTVFWYNVLGASTLHVLGNHCP